MPEQQFTSETYRVLAQSIATGGQVGADNRDIVAAALRTASRVMEPGVIGQAVMRFVEASERGEVKYTTASCEAVIRKALTEES